MASTDAISPIDDIVEGVIRILDRPAQGNSDWNSDQPDPGTSRAPWRVYNIGNNLTMRQRVSRLVRLSLSFSKKLENHIGAIWYFIHYYNRSLV